MKTAARGCSVRFCVRVELSGKETLPDEMIKKVSEALEEISPKLKLA